MARLSPAFLAAALAALCCAAALPAQEPPPESPYFPLKVGTRWEYRTGQRVIVTTVVKHEQIDKQWWARLETTSEGRTLSEHVGVLPGGIYRLRADGMEVIPPLLLLKLTAEKDKPPAVKADTWKVDARSGGLKITGTFKAELEPELTVRGTRYVNVVSVTGADFQYGGDKMAVTTWYAPNVGVVKQLLKSGGADVLIELEKYEAGK